MNNRRNGKMRKGGRRLRPWPPPTPLGGGEDEDEMEEIGVRADGLGMGRRS